MANLNQKQRQHDGRYCGLRLLRKTVNLGVDPLDTHWQQATHLVLLVPDCWCIFFFFVAALGLVIFAGVVNGAQGWHVVS